MVERHNGKYSRGILRPRHRLAPDGVGKTVAADFEFLIRSLHSQPGPAHDLQSMRTMVLKFKLLVTVGCDAIKTHSNELNAINGR